MEKVTGRLIWLVGWAVDDDVLVKVVCATHSHGITVELCINRQFDLGGQIHHHHQSVVQNNEATRSDVLPSETSSTLMILSVKVVSV